MYRKIEEILYSHYEKKNKINRLKNRLSRIDNRIKVLKQDIKECNIEMQDTMKSMDYSKNSRNSNKVSIIEIELERAFNVLEKRIKTAYHNKYKLINRIRDLEKRIENIDIVLNELDEEELQLVEYKYNDKYGWIKISKIQHCSTATIYRKKDKIIEYLSNELIK
ncbi:hypothetical protein [Abyssisolibacter fermentans]|uniref:hypothetical protein n=1 Tax=Abyssisolibacter fermentans TaxID=1766203 RepID=UPI00082F9559|nr:hypothetical protein [Abyssisolibacter fermentans]